MPTKFAGIDCSTNSIAYGVIQDGQLIHYGEEFFKGATVFERLLDARNVTKRLVESGRLDVDVVIFEKAVVVHSAATAMKMAYVFGTCMAEIMAGGAKIMEVSPLDWQKSVNNPILTKSEKLQLQRDFPGKSKTWYSGKGRETRKQRTMDFIENEYGIKCANDNISDAIGVAHHASKTFR